ncbi:MAG: thymidine phosphorylase [Thermoleophilia bacterium]|nr:thymidine phosphorylase [Thermoleophilia bacterium]
MRPAELIERKRDGYELAAGELERLVLAYARGDVPEEQMAAFCMAVYFRGLTPRETFELTDAMVRSGGRIDLSPLGRIAVDKHSTGGVGDKVTIALGPVVAASGVPFAKLSGRGLGHTGGTLDKLEAIPGFTTELAPEAFVRQVAEIGLAVAGQSEGLVPADRRLYALRDVTATIDELSLIAASVMAKKIAAGAGAILLDVKVGEGAFVKTLADARRLAGVMLELGRRAGLRVVCELTRMDEPLGAAVGNALEVREALAFLRGGGPEALRRLVLASAGKLLALSDLGVGEDEGRRRAEAAVGSGEALAVYERWVRAQGGDPREEALPRAPVVAAVPAPAAGRVEALSALAIGRAALHLGAGRARKDDRVDPATGVVCLRLLGDAVARGEPLAEVHARTMAAAAAAAVEVAAAYRLGPGGCARSSPVLEVVG